MQITGYGTGATPEEAAADARNDLDRQIATLRFGNIIGLGAGGVLALGLTAFTQFLYRPIPTLIVGFASWILWLILSNMVLAAMPEDVFSSLLLMGLLCLAALPLIALFAAVFAVACTQVELYERRFLAQLPDAPRGVLVTATSLVPTLLAVFWAAVSIPEDGLPTTSGGWLWAVAYVAFFAVVQWHSIQTRQRWAAVLGDFDWRGRRVEPRAELPELVETTD